MLYGFYECGAGFSRVMCRSLSVSLATSQSHELTINFMGEWISVPIQEYLECVEFALSKIAELPRMGKFGSLLDDSTVKIKILSNKKNVLYTSSRSPKVNIAKLNVTF